jgi:hypothetical protein
MSSIEVACGPDAMAPVSWAMAAVDSALKAAPASKAVFTILFI